MTGSWGFSADRRGDRVVFGGGPAAGLLAGGSGWRVDGGRGALEGATIDSSGVDGSELVLRRAGGEGEDAELGRAYRDSTLGPEADLYYLLMGDGRVFRLIPRGGREGGFALLGWETPGAFLEATAEAVGWSVVANPAGRGLPDLDVVSVLFAAAILDAEHPLQRRPTPGS